MMKNTFPFTQGIMAAMICSVAVSTSCTKEQTNPEAGFSSGAYIVNEGGFMKNNGSVTYYDRDSLIIYENLFAQVNGRGLGDVVQSFSIAGNMGLIVVNNSQKVEVIDLESFSALATITGVDYPRYALAIDDRKVYLTDGNYQGNIVVIDLSSMLIINQIPVGYGPENLVRSRDLIFVANSGGWAYDNTISVVDPENDAVVGTIRVGDHPVDLVLDADLDIWALCKGKVEYDANWNIIGETDSKIYRIRSDNWEVTDSFTIGTRGDFFNPIRMTASKDGSSILYIEADGIYKFDYRATQPPADVFIPGRYYGLDVDPVDGTLFAFKANGFDSKGKAYLYSMSGKLLDSLQVGIAPNGAAFR
jgi:YVTN family beta-propeller protein